MGNNGGSLLKYGGHEDKKKSIFLEIKKTKD